MLGVKGLMETEDTVNGGEVKNVKSHTFCARTLEHNYRSYTGGLVTIVRFPGIRDGVRSRI